MENSDYTHVQWGLNTVGVFLATGKIGLCCDNLSKGRYCTIHQSFNCSYVFLPNFLPNQESCYACFKRGYRGSVSSSFYDTIMRLLLQTKSNNFSHVLLYILSKASYAALALWHLRSFKLVTVHPSPILLLIPAPYCAFTCLLHFLL